MTNGSKSSNVYLYRRVALTIIIIIFICFYVVWIQRLKYVHSRLDQPRHFVQSYTRVAMFQDSEDISQVTDEQYHWHGLLHDPAIPKTQEDLLKDLSQRNRSNCSSWVNVGPICRGPHMTTLTSSKSSCTVFGNGLNRASVGKCAYVTIKTPISKRKELYEKFVFSVLAVGENHIFYGTPTAVNEDTLEVNFTYVPTIPGSYDLYVEDMSRKRQMQLPGSPFKLVVDGPSINIKERRAKFNRLPSCQTLPQTNLSWSEGDWVTRDLAGDRRGTLRSGWVLQPNRCSIDIFTGEELELAAASPTLKTIVVLGRSIERGVFSTLVDIALKREQKLKMSSSVVWKCWGFMEVRIGNLRFIYQDFRIEIASMSKIKYSNTVNITCHNEKKISSNNDFFGDAVGFFQETLFTDRFRPDVVLMIVTNSLQLKLLANAIPKTWNGTFYAMNGFKCHEQSLYTSKGRNADLDKAKEFVTFDKRIRVLDGFSVATPMRHSAESPPLIMKFMHWHRDCDEHDGNIRVCGDATEMVAQIVLGRLIAPEGKAAWLASLEQCERNGNDTAVPVREFQICHDCPTDLFPQHIKRSPQLTCYTSTEIQALNSTGIRIWDGSLCPSKCMETEPVSEAHTRSGTVNVRICNILKNDITAD